MGNGLDSPVDGIGGDMGQTPRQLREAAYEKLRVVADGPHEATSGILVLIWQTLEDINEAIRERPKTASERFLNQIVDEAAKMAGL